jgi:hypothetical protein
MLIEDVEVHLGVGHRDIYIVQHYKKCEYPELFPSHNAQKSHFREVTRICSELEANWLHPVLVQVRASLATAICGNIYCSSVHKRWQSRFKASRS